MPYREKEIQKMYWSIGEVSDRLGVNASCIRYWLREFGFDAEVKRSKTHAGDRRFKAADVAKLEEIKRLLSIELFTIPGAKRKLQQTSAPASSDAQ